MISVNQQPMDSRPPQMDSGAPRIEANLRLSQAAATSIPIATAIRARTCGPERSLYTPCLTASPLIKA